MKVIYMVLEVWCGIRVCEVEDFYFVCWGGYDNLMMIYVFDFYLLGIKIVESCVGWGFKSYWV